MVKHKLDSTFNALSDPTRRDILQRLILKEFTVSEIAEAYNISLAAVSKHLKVLEAANLITKERRGRQQFVKISSSALRDVSEHMLYYELLLNTRLDSLEAYLTKPAAKTKSTSKNADDEDIKQPLVMTHIFDAPLEKVWQAYTDPQQITEWWAPKGAALIACESDARVGGQWRFVLYGNDNQQHIFSGIFREVEKPKRLVYTDGFGEADELRPESLVTVAFEDLPGGRTRITKTSLATPAVHQLQAALIKSIERTL